MARLRLTKRLFFDTVSFTAPTFLRTSRRPLFLFRLAVLVLALLVVVGSALAWTPNPQEIALADVLTHSSGQHRPFLVADPILSQVARDRAADMAQRGYFDHINPDGHGANYLVRKAGYVLPSYYPSDGNNLESISGGFTSAAAAWDDWMNSPDHKTHLLAEESFFATQTSFGVGYFADPASTYKHYWVIITAPPMPAPPALTITTPDEGAALPEGAVTMAGTTTGSTLAREVQLRVDGSAENAWVTVPGTQTWSRVLGSLHPGSNTVTARSLGENGVVLAQTSRTFRYVVQRPLTVQVEGEGSVGGFLGTTSRELAKTYRITATPAPGWLFAGWSGSWGGTQSAVEFTMRTHLAVTATFVPNPFATVHGTYRGLFGAIETPHEQRGALEMLVGRKGSFSGRLLFAGKSYPLLGQFQLDGSAALRLARGDAPALKLRLHLDLTEGFGTVTGILQDGEHRLELSVALVPQVSGPNAFKGRYTLALPAAPENAEAPSARGDGYAVLTVSEDGAARLVGALADGTLFNRGGWLRADGQLEIYAPLYAGRGSLTGTLQFGDLPESDLAGSVRWSKPKLPAGSPLRAAFSTTLPAIGSRFVEPPAARPLLAVEAVVGNARLAFGEGDLSTEVAQLATIAPDNTVTVTAPSLPGLQVTVYRHEWPLQRCLSTSRNWLNDALSRSRAAKAEPRSRLLPCRTAERLRELVAHALAASSSAAKAFAAGFRIWAGNPSGPRKQSDHFPPGAKVIRKSKAVSARSGRRGLALRLDESHRARGGVEVVAALALPFHSPFPALQSRHRGRSRNRSHAIVGYFAQPLLFERAVALRTKGLLWQENIRGIAAGVHGPVAVVALHVSVRQVSERPVLNPAVRHVCAEKRRYGGGKGIRRTILHRIYVALDAGGRKLPLGRRAGRQWWFAGEEHSPLQFGPSVIAADAASSERVVLLTQK